MLYTKVYIEVEKVTWICISNRDYSCCSLLIWKCQQWSPELQAKKLLIKVFPLSDITAAWFLSLSFFLFFWVMNILPWCVHNRTAPIHNAADTHLSAHPVWLFSASFWRCQRIPNFSCKKNIIYYFLPTLQA